MQFNISEQARGSEGAPLGGGRADRAGDACEASKTQGWAGANARCTAKPLTKTMRATPDKCHKASTPLGRQAAARRARSDRGAPTTGDRTSKGNFA